MDGIVPTFTSGGDDKAQSYRKAVKVLNKVQKDVRDTSNTLTNGSLATAQSVLRDVTEVTQQTQEMLEFPTKLRDHVSSFGATILSLQSQTDNLRSIPFSDGCVRPLIQFLNAAAKPVRAIRDAATKAEEMTLPAKEHCARAVDLVDTTKGKVDWLQSDMARVVNMVDKFAGAGKNTLRAAKEGSEMLEVAEGFGCGKQAKLCMAGVMKSQFNSALMQTAIKACHAVYDSLTLCHGCTNKVVNLKDTMEEGKGMMSREVDVVGNKVSGLRGQLDDLISDISSFNLSGVATKCTGLKSECDALMGSSSNGDSLKRKVETKVMKPLEILHTVVDAIKSLFHTLEEQTKKSEEAEKKTREAPTLENGKPDLSHMEGCMKEITDALRSVIDVVAPVLGIQLEEGLFDVLEDDNDKNTSTDHATREDDVAEDGETPLDSIFGAFASKLADSLKQ